MSKELVRRWYEKIPPIERDDPILYMDGKYWTPDEIYNEVMRDTPTGRKLQAKLEKLSAPRTFSFSELKELRKVAEERIKKTLEALPNEQVLVTYTPQGKIAFKPKDILKTELYEKAVKEEVRSILKTIKQFGE